MSKLMMSSCAVLCAASVAFLGGAVNEANASPVGGEKGADFTIGPNATQTWTVECNDDDTRVHVQFSQFTNMELEAWAGGRRLDYDHEPGAFYDCFFTHRGTVTIRLRNVGGGSYTGHVHVR